MQTQRYRPETKEFVRKIFFAYKNAKTPAATRDHLLQLKTAVELLSLIDPAIIKEEFESFKEVEVSDSELENILSSYYKSMTTPDEKIYLAKIQSCAIRSQIARGEEGVNQFLKKMEQLQKNSHVKLVLM